MASVKYAIIFPEYWTVNHDHTISIFSESSIKETTDTFFETFDALGSLMIFIGQKNRTKELSKQISVKKNILDISIENFEEQKRIKFEEDTKRLQIQLETEKERLKLATEKLILEASTSVNDCVRSFEKHMVSSRILWNVISEQRRFLENIENYIENLADEYGQRKEYVWFCELQRRSLNLIDQYMAEMI